MLDHLFNPRSVAVVGASNDPSKLGSVFLKNIIEGGYRGTIYPINPRSKTIMGLRAFPSILDVNGVDLAIIATPAKNIIEILEQCTDGAVKTAIVFSSGFGELSEEGKRIEREMVSVARRSGLRFVGPNSVGIFSSSSHLHAMMPELGIKRGTTSLVSQSGNVGSQTLYRGSELGIGFNMFVSSGNEADLYCEDYIDFFRQEPETKVILAYIEGLRDARKFLETAKRTTAEKPIIALKGGDTEAGADTVHSHTGVMAGSAHIYNAALKQSGIVQAETIEDLHDFALAFNSNLYPKSRRIVVLTRGGGWGVVAADACEKAGLELPNLPSEIIAQLNKILPSYWNRKNPIDTVMASGFTLMTEILDIIGRWDDVDGIIILGGFGGYFAKIWKEKDPEMVSKKIVELSRTKVVFGVSFTQDKGSGPAQLLRENNVPVYYEAKRAIRAYSKLVEYQQYVSMSNTPADR